MRYAIRHENTCIVTFFIPTNLFLARPNTSLSLEKKYGEDK